MIETFGARLKRLRTSKQLSQDQVASLIGVNRATVSNYESDTRQPPYVTLTTLATLFKVSTDYLLGYQSEVIDTSGLTQEEVLLIRELVDGMREKNRKLNECEIDS
jgi:transcriptional regulator with XRE-family HTH domain